MRACQLVAVVVGVLALTLTGPAGGSMVYYLPFQDNVVGLDTLENYGTIGGLATEWFGAPNQSSPTASTPPVVGLNWARDMSMPSGGTRLPELLLPDSGSRFKMTTAGDKISVAAWIYLNPLGPIAQYRGIAEKSTSAMSDGWMFKIYLNQLVFRRWDGTWVDWNLSSLTLTEGQWEHVAFTWTAGSNLTIYLNGVGQDMGNVAAVVGAGTTWGIGVGGFTGDNGTLDGLMDEVRIYDEILTQAQIQALMIPEPASFSLLALATFAARFLYLRRRR